MHANHSPQSVLPLLLVALVCWGCDAPQDSANGPSGRETPPAVEPSSDPPMDASEQQPPENEQKPSEDVTIEQVESETKEALSAASRLAQQQREEYRSNLEERINKVEQDIQALKRQAEQEANQITPELQQFFDEVDQKLSTTQRQVRERASSTSEAWQELSEGIDAAISDLERAAQEARDKVRPADPQQPAQGGESNGALDPDASDEATAPPNDS